MCAQTHTIEIQSNWNQFTQYFLLYISLLLHARMHAARKVELKSKTIFLGNLNKKKKFNWLDWILKSKTGVGMCESEQIYWHVRAKTPHTHIFIICQINYSLPLCMWCHVNQLDNMITVYVFVSLPLELLELYYKETRISLKFSSYINFLFAFDILCAYEFCFSQRKIWIEFHLHLH